MAMKWLPFLLPTLVLATEMRFISNYADGQGMQGMRTRLTKIREAVRSMLASLEKDLQSNQEENEQVAFA